MPKPPSRGGGPKPSGPPPKSSAAQNKKAEEIRNKAAAKILPKLYPPIGVDKKIKKRGRQGVTEVVLPPDPGPAFPPPDTGDFSFPPPPVMVPERDVVNLATEQLDAKTIENLLFENIGANELIKFVRHDTVEGNNPSYNIISNLSDIRRKFNPDELISVQTSDSNFISNSINLNNKIPSDEYLESLGLTDYVYIDDSGNLVIEVVNMRDKEVVEVQIDSNGTIYEVN